MPHVPSFAISYTIRRARRAAGLSQEELASRMGMSPQAVSKWEIGESRPTHLAFSRLARALNLSREELEWGYGVELPLVGPREIEGEGRVVPSGQTILLPALDLGGAELARMLGKPGNFAWISRGDRLAAFANIRDGVACVVSPKRADDEDFPLEGPILLAHDGTAGIAVLRDNLNEALERVNDDGVFLLPASGAHCLGRVIAAFTAIGSPGGFYPANPYRGYPGGIPILKPEEHRRFACQFIKLEETIQNATIKGANLLVMLSYPEAPGRNIFDRVEIFLPIAFLLMAADPAVTSETKLEALRRGASIHCLANEGARGTEPPLPGERVRVCGTWAEPALLLAFITEKLAAKKELGEILENCEKQRVHQALVRTSEDQEDHPEL